VLSCIHFPHPKNPLCAFVHVTNALAGLSQITLLICTVYLFSLKMSPVFQRVLYSWQKGNKKFAIEDGFEYPW